MRVQTKVVRVGNSWGIRLPKTALALSGLKPNKPVDLEVRKGRLILRLPGSPKEEELDKLRQAHKDAQAVWNQALEDTWLEIFGPDYD